MCCFLHEVVPEEVGHSGATVAVYKAQIADLAKKAATLEKVMQ